MLTTKGVTILRWFIVGTIVLYAMYITHNPWWIFGLLFGYLENRG